VSAEALEKLVDGLLVSYERDGGINHIDDVNLPSQQGVRAIMLGIQSLLFPGFVETEQVNHVNFRFAVGKRAADTFDALRHELVKSFRYALREPTCRDVPKLEQDVEEHAYCIVVELFEALPQIRALLSLDAQAAMAGDPAARSVAEVLLSYPGMHAISIHRVAHFLFKRRVPLIPRMMAEQVHARTGIDIHPGATIDEAFFIDHGTGVVIGETAHIGKRVKIYQGVTLGALSVPAPEVEGARVLKRHPTIEDDVTIYAGATILGGNTVVGARSVVGGSVWLTRSVPPDTKVLYQPPELKIKTSAVVVESR
jgi:serine O-acetyltransferase